ncbi:hypothetical protein GCM10023176_61650 [Micromonospora coerulea]|uniref:SMODS and SLOG-associating 2TM effector domain-containing protein n=1 Tax=Micromonospora coerulea TaxID=47856 RepID=A0ABP8T3Y1_9ACTN
MAEPSWADLEILLRRWLKRAREGQHSHHEAGKFLRRAHYGLGVPVIVITTSLGTAAFATISLGIGTAAKAWFGGLSMLAAVLAALQTQFRYLERSEKHKATATRYGNIRRQIEAILALPESERGQPGQALKEVREKLDAISADADAVSSRIFKKTRDALAADDERERRESGEGQLSPDILHVVQ